MKSLNGSHFQLDLTCICFPLTDEALEYQFTISGNISC